MFTVGQFRVLLQGVEIREMAARMLKVYEDTRRDATGNAECRRISRMEQVVKAVLEEVVEEVEGAETESV